jgi:hypothetical protein
MLDRENPPNSPLWNPSLHPPLAKESDSLGWSLLGLMSELPEILIDYLLIKIRRAACSCADRYGKLSLRKCVNGFLTYVAR